MGLGDEAANGFISIPVTFDLQALWVQAATAETDAVGVLVAILKSFFIHLQSRMICSQMKRFFG